MLVIEENPFRRTLSKRQEYAEQSRIDTTAKLHAKLDRILIALDFSPASMRAFDYGTGLAQHVGASVLVVHVMDPMYAIGSLQPLTNLALKEEKREEIKRRLTGIAERTDFDGLVSVRVVEGSPDDAIVDLAAKTGCDLIVMGQTKRLGL